MKPKSIRVVLVVTSANPELLDDLDKVPPRLRAERVRTLATLGIASLSCRPQPAAQVAQTQQQPDAPASEKKLSRAQRLAQSFGEKM